MFIRKKLDSILTALTSTVHSLDNYVSQGTEDLGVNEVKLALLEKKRDEISGNITQAQVVSTNLKVLLNMEQ